MGSSNVYKIFVNFAVFLGYLTRSYEADCLWRIQDQLVSTRVDSNDYRPKNITIYLVNSRCTITVTAGN